MRKKRKDQRLQLLQSESRLIEPGTGERLRIVLVYPAPYSVGMANLGFHLIYSAFNRIRGVCCHRAFAPWTTFSQRVTPRIPVPVSLETGEALSKYDVVALSLNYENDILNVFRLFKAAGINLLSTERSHREPLVIAGGVVVTINPEPFADLTDICVLGEADELIPELCQILINEWSTHRDRLETLLAASEVPGFYIPSLYKPVYSENNQFIDIVSNTSFKPPVLKRRLVSDLDSIPSSTVIHSLNTKFPELHIIEISRSCPRSCRFCLIPGCYGKFRYRSVDAIMEAAKMAPAGWRIGLLGAGAADHPHLVEICEVLASKGYSFSFSSLHASSISDPLAAIIHKNGPRTITLAPEVATDTRRAKLGKSITNEDLNHAVEIIGRYPLRTIKTYFMVGLPGETDEDLYDIPKFCLTLENTLRKTNLTETSIPRLSVGVSCFVPKALSPFERASLHSEKVFRKKLRIVVSGLNKILELSWNHDVPKWAVVQGVIARGDRRLINWFIDSAEPGADWRKILKSETSPVILDKLQNQKLSGRLPWNHLKTPLFSK
ncbi:B12-binding domain-containing radical SAM protein [bacterium]|nr:B12-binding domain-containing radical SAM protein [bacterium]